MFTKSLLLLCATAASVVATNNLNFIYSTSSYDDIGGDGSGYSTGFTIKDTSGNTLWHRSDPDGYAPCMEDSEKFTMTSDCWTGTWTFGCESKFDGKPKLCAAYSPDDVKYSGKVDSSEDFIGISAGSEGTCGGSFYAAGETCTKDSTFKVTGRYRGNLRD
ncbi:hypothetical protein BO70DRAFT_352121 [Aspergillus heteromorphus CBS 117.55]|uniref:Uncharacterized protein n=1 Tax=Aspergillus heteromorphus CBS 117.55 TaxID=1448321 RepID=A0A317WF35_9EURO|nr:uncharacterized protein BO70DRAFT_352121 [Aspergillus heteromorphus CBS 117.55]PWY85013.1 hypothetical protein BO70DRAFT_352121 [Aspergillus heteromorphus CBS 117.55]